jgi:hypothetical protein
MVENKDILVYLDSFVMNERKYSYYDTCVVLYANTMDRNGVVLQLSSGRRHVYSPIISQCYVDSTCGVFFHNLHLFVLYGRSIISNQLMRKTSNSFLIKVKMEEKGDFSKSGEDDSYFPTTWIGKFDGRHFFIINRIEMRPVPPDMQP